MLNDGHTSARGWTGTRIRKLVGSRSALLVAMLAVLFAAISSPSYAETGSVRFKFFKAGWFVGAQTGSGILEFRDQIYPFHVGGISAGLTFGGSSTDFVGTARNMHQPTDIEGVYTALGVPNGVQNIDDIEASLANAQSAMTAATSQHQTTSNTLTNLLQSIEGVDTTQSVPDIMSAAYAAGLVCGAVLSVWVLLGAYRALRASLA